MDYTETKERIKHHEGCVLSIYADPLLGDAAPTIFYGHLCTATDPWEPGITYSQEDAENVFEQDFAVAVKDANAFIGDTETPDIVRSVIVEMAFNIGINRLMGFRKLRQAIYDQDYIEAADQIMDSKLYRQLTSRYAPLVEMVAHAA